MTDWDLKKKEEVGAAVRALSDCANHSCPSQLFVWFMSQEHRALQQSMTGLFLAWFEHLATLDEYQYDLRNEDSVRFAKIFMKAIKDAGMIPHLR